MNVQLFLLLPCTRRLEGTLNLTIASNSVCVHQNCPVLLEGGVFDDMSRHAFAGKRVRIGYVNGARFNHPVIDVKVFKASLTWNRFQPTLFSWPCSSKIALCRSYLFLVVATLPAWALALLSIMCWLFVRPVPCWVSMDTATKLSPYGVGTIAQSVLLRTNAKDETLWVLGTAMFNEMHSLWKKVT